MSTILTTDGVRIHVDHITHPHRETAAEAGLVIVVAHGFSGSTSRPAQQRVLRSFAAHSDVVALDFRGHGRSAGLTTVGDREIHDLEAAVGWARRLGYQQVATVGFSMGGAVAVRHAGVLGGVDAVVSVSAPASWFYRDTVPMQRLHWMVETPAGRRLTRLWRGTRVDPAGWATTPLPPFEAAARIAPTPLLVVHGDRDPFFPVAHGERLYDSAHEPRELWIRAGLGHAEAATDGLLVAEIVTWLRAQLAPAAGGAEPRRGAEFPTGGSA